MRTLTFLLTAIASLSAPVQAQPTGPASPTAFRAIELRGGGLVTVRHAPVRRVTVRVGNPGRPIRSEGDRLVIDRCGGECPRGHRIEVEIATPEIARLAVTDGGLVQVVGGFPSQAAIAASVSSGGTIDIRSLKAASVSAAVSQGGRILASPDREMAATVADGGIVTYWGDAKIRSSVRRGGAVVRGDASDLRLPIARLDPPLPPLTALPPLPRTH